MKLLMIESKDKGTWYFTGIQQCADFLDVSYNAVNYWLKGVAKTCKGFNHFEWVDSFDVFHVHINADNKQLQYGNFLDKKQII